MHARDRLPTGQPGRESDRVPLPDPAATVPLADSAQRPSNTPRPATLASLPDTDLAPLGVPAVVLGLALIAAGMLAVPVLDELTEDYGPLVTVAFVVLVGAAVGCCRWGWITARTTKRPSPTK